ncbi:MAG: hypothetical protein QW041_03205 [Candidatus Pacearchaeota archaeon]
MGKKAVVWISTVLYTLISLAIIAALMAVIQPKVTELKDKYTVEQTVQSLNILDERMMTAKQATGMNLNYRINLDKGALTIDGYNEKIYWNFISKYQYSEENKIINVGKIKAVTKPSADLWNVTLSLEYKQHNINITTNGKDEIKTITPAGLPYSLWITNKGIKSGISEIDITIE